MTVDTSSEPKDERLVDAAAVLSGPRASLMAESDDDQDYARKLAKMRKLFRQVD